MPRNTTPALCQATHSPDPNARVTRHEVSRQPPASNTPEAPHAALSATEPGEDAHPGVSGP